MDLNIVHENDDEITAFCCFHNDKGRPNMILNKNGPYAGEYRCWACGANGLISDLGLERAVKKTRRKKKKSPREMWSIWAEFPYTDDWIVPTEHLRAYGIKWNQEKDCWVCPMLNPKGQICGLQRRFKNGRKICISGSKLGVFATSNSRQELLVICEGLSDCIAAANLGFDAIGRPSALVIKPVVNWVEANTNNAKIVIVSDGNEVGIQSAQTLSIQLTKIYSKEIHIAYPTHKDLSEDIAAGLGEAWVRRIKG